MKAIKTAGHLNELELSIRTANGLSNMTKNRDQPIAEFLKEHPPNAMLKIRNFGKKSLAEFAFAIGKLKGKHFDEWASQVEPARKIKIRTRLARIRSDLTKLTLQIAVASNRLDLIDQRCSKIEQLCVHAVNATHACVTDHMDLNHRLHALESREHSRQTSPFRHPST